MQHLLRNICFKMPRTAQFTKDDIAEKALQIIEVQGVTALTARSLGKMLGVSSSPIFTIFDNMEEVVEEARRLGQSQFDSLMSDVTDYSPAFKEFGMRLIRFARDRSNVFAFLFLDESADNSLLMNKVRECLIETEEHFNLSKEQIDILFRQMWIFACGLSVLCSQNPHAHSEEEISEMLSCQFSAILHFLKSGQNVANIEPKKKNR